MSTRTTPLIRTLDRAGCDAVLPRNHVDRIAAQEVSGREALPAGAAE